MSSKVVGLMRKCRLWVKVDKRLILYGIRQTLSREERTLLGDDNDALALIKEWRPTHACVTGDR
eukprot:3510852-Karenia_brevis.AAC.1